MSAAVPPPGPPPAPRSRFWRYAQALTAPVLLWVLVAFLLWEPIHNWIEGEDSYDKSALEEWLDEARTFRKTLPEMAADYAQTRQELQQLPPPPPHPGPFDPQVSQRGQVERTVAVQGEQILEHLRALGNPPTKMYNGQLPLFPTIYRIEVIFDDRSVQPIVWDSELPFRETEVQELKPPVAVVAGVGPRFLPAARLQHPAAPGAGAPAALAAA